MKSTTRGLWRFVRSLLLIACAAGILAADNTWLSSINFDAIEPANWFSSDPANDLADKSLADTTMLSDRPAYTAPLSQQSISSVTGLPFAPRHAGFWTNSQSNSSITSAWMAEQSSALVNQSSSDLSLALASAGFPISPPPSGVVLPNGAGGLTGNWTANTSGNWGTASNWAGGVIPTGANSNAHLDTLNITTDVTVNLDTSRTVGELYIGDTNGTNHYSIAPVLGSTLTFDNAGAASVLTQSSTSAGDAIAVQILLKNDLSVNNTSANVFTLSGGIASSVTGPAFQNVSFAGNITVSGNITNGTTGATVSVQINSGTVLFLGGNTYTGTTDVSGGTLLINGDNSGATATVFVSGSGTLLGGTGAIGGNVYMFGSSITGGTDTSVGTLTLQQNLVMATGEGAGGTYLANLSGNKSDKLAISGNLTLGFGTTLSISGTADGTTTYILATFATHLGTFDTTSGIPAGYALVYNTTDLELVPIPEPATWLGGAIALGALLWTQRRRVRRFTLR